MVIRGRVEEGKITIDVRGLLPDGTEVFLTPAYPNEGMALEDERVAIETARAIIQQIAALPSESPDDGFSSADHDTLLYGKAT